MILLNFSHPLTTDQLDQVAALTREPVEQVIELPVQFDHQLPFLPQLMDLMRMIPLSPAQLQTEPLLVNPPSFNFVAVLVLAALHGRMGYFPPVIRLRPVAGSLPPRFEVAEILNLQAVRDSARLARYE